MNDTRKFDGIEVLKITNGERKRAKDEKDRNLKG